MFDDKRAVAAIHSVEFEQIVVIAIRHRCARALRESLDLGKRNQVGVVVQAQLHGCAVVVNMHAVNAAFPCEQVLQARDALVAVTFDLR